MYPLFRRVNVTDFREKEYVALPLAIHVAADPYMDANYLLDSKEVYKKVVKFCISSEDTLDVLGIYSDSAQVSSLPSWVPDWSVRQLVNGGY